MLEGLAGVRLRKEEADHAERRVWEVTRWSDLVEEKKGFVEAAFQSYKVLVEDKGAGKTGGAAPSQRYETRFRPKKNDAGVINTPDKAKKVGYRLSMDIERTTDLRKVLEEWILDNKVRDVAERGAWDRQGVPRLHCRLGEAEKTFNGSRA